MGAPEWVPQLIRNNKVLIQQIHPRLGLTLAQTASPGCIADCQSTALLRRAPVNVVLGHNYQVSEVSTKPDVCWHIYFN